MSPSRIGFYQNVKDFSVENILIVYSNFILLASEVNQQVEESVFVIDVRDVEKHTLQNGFFHLLAILLVG
jgi:hypothetical protein